MRVAGGVGLRVARAMRVRNLARLATAAHIVRAVALSHARYVCHTCRGREVDRDTGGTRWGDIENGLPPQKFFNSRTSVLHVRFSQPRMMVELARGAQVPVWRP